MRELRIPALGAALFAALVACTTDEFVYQAGVPGARIDAEVGELTTRGAWIDARVQTGGADLRFFFPATPTCRAVLGADDVRYANVGALGRLRSGDRTCDPVGILSLRAWRQRRPRPADPELVPRAQAVFDEHYRDEDLIVLEGRFPLAGRIGWVGGVDTLAVVPRREPCPAVVEQGVASMEFRDAGPRVFDLVADRGLCPLVGFVMKPEQMPEPDEGADAAS